MITFPTVLFTLVIASLYGSVYHLIRNGGPWKLLLYVLYSWVGFWLGHIFGAWLDLHFLRLGPLNLGFSTLGSFLVLFLGDWFSTVAKPTKPHLPDDQNGV